MVFGKKKTETAEEKEARLRKELAEIEERNAKTNVQEMKNDKNGVEEPASMPEKAEKSLLDELDERYGAVFPELGPSGHAHVERILLLGILEELRRQR